MISKVINTVEVHGKIHSTAKLVKTEVKGVDVIRGNVSIATDPAGTQVVEVSVYAPKVWGSGKENRGYAGWLKFLDAKTVETDGLAKADSARITGSFSENRYFREENGEYTLSSFIQIRGGFGHVDSNARPSSVFKIEGIVRLVEPNEDGTLMLKLDVFDDYNKFFYPIKLAVNDSMAINYISTNYDADSSYVTISGAIESTVVTRESDASELGFGEETVQSSYTKTQYVVKGGTPPREVNMTDEEMTAALNARKTKIAEEKAARIEYDATRGKGNDGFPADKPAAKAAAPKVAASTDAFDF